MNPAPTIATSTSMSLPSEGLGVIGPSTPSHHNDNERYRASSAEAPPSATSARSFGDAPQRGSDPPPRLGEDVVQGVDHEVDLGLAADERR